MPPDQLSFIAYPTLLMIMTACVIALLAYYSAIYKSIKLYFEFKNWVKSMLCLHQIPTKACVNKKFNLLYCSYMKKRDMRLLIGHITCLICEKSDTGHLIGLHQFGNKIYYASFQCANLSMYKIKCSWSVKPTT